MLLFKNLVFELLTAIYDIIRLMIYFFFIYLINPNVSQFFHSSFIDLCFALLFPLKFLCNKNYYKC